jgi:hypothetical protein
VHYAVSESRVLDMRVLAAANDSLPSFHNSPGRSSGGGGKPLPAEALAHNQLISSKGLAGVIVVIVGVDDDGAGDDCPLLLRKNRRSTERNKNRSISPLYLRIIVDDRVALLTGKPITLSMVDLWPRSRVRRKYCGSSFRTTTRRHEFARVCFSISSELSQAICMV